MAHRSGNATWEDWPSTVTQITAARMEGIENAIDGPRPGTRARSAASQTIAAAGTWTVVALPFEDFDDLNGHSTSTNTGRWVAPFDCRVRVSASVLWSDAQSTTNPGRSLRLVKNGAQIPNTQILGSYPGIFYSLTLPPTLVALAATEYVELQVLTGLAGSSLFGGASDGAVLTVELA